MQWNASAWIELGTQAAAAAAATAAEQVDRCANNQPCQPGPNMGAVYFLWLSQIRLSFTRRALRVLSLLRQAYVTGGQGRGRMGWDGMRWGGVLLALA